MVSETSECLAYAATEDDSPVMSENECYPRDDDSENSDENTDSDPEELSGVFLRNVFSERVILGD